MNIDDLEKAADLNKKIKFVKEVQNDLDEVVVIVGSKRIDEYMDVNDRLANVMKTELNVIEQEILNEISTL